LPASPALARALRIAAGDLLVRVGYYRPGDFTAPPPPSTHDLAQDEALRIIEESDFPPRIKARMRQRLAELRAQRAASEVEEVKWWLDQARGAS